MTPQERKVLELALQFIESNADSDSERELVATIKEALAQPERDYERGFIDGMQKQMQSSVDKAVNRLAQLDQDEVDIRSRLYQRIHELETQLAQQEQGPVLVECGNCHEGLADMEHVCKKCLGAGWVNNPQLKEPEQEPVAWMDEDMDCIFFDTERPEPFSFDFWKPLYTTPPQRKPLTDEQIAEMWLEILGSTPPSGIHEDGLQPWRFARAIEAAHGIKE